MVLVVVVVLQGAVQLVENEIERLLLADKSLLFGQIWIAYDLERELLTLLHDLVSLELDFFVVDLFELELSVVLVLIELDQRLEVAVVFVLVRVDDVVRIVVVDHDSRLVVDLTVYELLAEALGHLCQLIRLRGRSL